MHRLLFIVLIFLVGCTSSRKFAEFDLNSPYIEYSSVKLKLNTKNFENVTLSGFVYLHKDSLICFKLYKTVFKVVSGFYQCEFKIYDHINNELHSDVIKQLVIKTGMVLNDKVVHSLLIADADRLVSGLKELNGNVIKISSSDNRSKKYVNIANQARRSEIHISFVYQNAIPKTIEMEYMDAVEKWSVAIEILKVNNIQRSCNFDF